jgi:ubiquinone/menaquinone biosynthesis C-methylase UbiE
MATAVEAYDALAPFYDRFTAAYRHDVWLDRVEQLVRGLGLRGRRLLDVACGTGKSFEPMLERGWDVTGCDISPGMVEIARTRHPREADGVFVGDMRALPDCGPFELVTCLDDALNYLLGEDDVTAAFESVARVLQPGGMLVFDCNSERTYATTFSTDFTVEADGVTFHWRGLADAEEAPGKLFRADIVVEGGERPGCRSRHVQRHHSLDEISRCLERAGLELVARRGQMTGARLTENADEALHPKLLHVARKPL